MAVGDSGGDAASTEVSEASALGDSSGADTSDAATLTTPVPTIDGPWRQISGMPDLGALNAVGQQPVDFAIWPAADGTWQLQSCIRYTKEAGGTRLFYRWQGAHFEDSNWTPVGIVMRADTTVGEQQGWLQAPFVVSASDGFHMLYGDGNDICQALSTDGKAFTRALTSAGVTPMYSDGPNTGTRDPMVLKVGDHWIAYDSANPGAIGGVYARTSNDLKSWSAATLVASGGAATGDSPYSAECPFVVYRPDVGLYYLFRNQKYGADAQDSVYASPDPMNFGVNDDTYFVTHLPIAAAEIVEYSGDTYIAALRGSLDGIQVAHLSWVAPK
ncbi:MAG: hypothetical protein ACHREM_19295 [Polyangiales bacterium]